jgi:WD40 repeat protein
VWDVAKGKRKCGVTTKKSFVIAAAIAPGGDRALMGGTDGVVRLFDVAKGAEIASAPGKGWIESIDCAGDGTFASGGRDKTVMLWDADAKPIRTLRGMTRNIACLSISTDGSRVVATGGGKPIVWNAKTGEILGTLAGDKVQCVRFSHDGATIATLGDDAVRIFETP